MQAIHANRTHWTKTETDDWVTSLCLILVFGGALVSATFFGMVIGVPALVAGLVLGALRLAGLNPFVSYLSKKTKLEGPCPYCTDPIVLLSSKSSFTCGRCRHEVVVRGDDFIALP
jgi:ribosomal protein S27AE